MEKIIGRKGRSGGNILGGKVWEGPEQGKGGKDLREGRRSQKDKGLREERGGKDLNKEKEAKDLRKEKGEDRGGKKRP